MHDHMTHAERPGAKSGNIAAGFEGFSRRFSAVKDFKPISGGIVEHNQIFNVPLAGESARSMGDFRA